MASLFSGRTLLAAGLRQQARRSAATGGRRAASSEAEKAAEAARIREYLKKHNAENGWSVVPPTHPLSCQPRFGPRCAGWRAPRACWPERPGGGARRQEELNPTAVAGLVTLVGAGIGCMVAGYYLMQDRYALNNELREHIQVPWSAPHSSRALSPCAHRHCISRPGPGAPCWPKLLHV